MSEGKVQKARLDHILVERGLAPNGSKARAMIMAGVVLVAGRVHLKAGELLPGDVSVEIIRPPHPYVSRGGLKLQAALEHFHVDVNGAVCLDAGASTGGFTHCLLMAGARRVYAADVGYGQLHLSLREDPRVVVMEKCNVRYLSREQIPGELDVITADLSFISLGKVIPALSCLLKEGGLFIPLVKPQFEAGRGLAKKGVVRDPQVRRETVEAVIAHGAASGLECRGVIPSPVAGPKGNVEFLLCLVKPARAGEAPREE